MRKRLWFVPLLVVLALVLVAPAASAATGGQGKAQAGGNNGKALGLVAQGTQHAANGAAHAAANASRGMNRLGAPGSWGERGHVPATVGDPQGHAPSDPDWTGNGGLDKPGETGGFNDDRDGNNGCGNDSDREDDNNGWCGKRPAALEPPEPPGPPPPAPKPKPPSIVLSGKTTPPSALPRTGIDASTLLFAGAGFVLPGVFLRRRGVFQRKGLRRRPFLLSRPFRHVGRKNSGEAAEGDTTFEPKRQSRGERPQDERLECVNLSQVEESMGGMSRAQARRCSRRRNNARRPEPQPRRR